MSMSVAHYLENMGVFLARAPTRDHMDIQELCITKPTPHWIQCSGGEALRRSGPGRMAAGRRASPKGKSSGELVLLVCHEVV